LAIRSDRMGGQPVRHDAVAACDGAEHRPFDDVRCVEPGTERSNRFQVPNVRRGL